MAKVVISVGVFTGLALRLGLLGPAANRPGCLHPGQFRCIDELRVLECVG